MTGGLVFKHLRIFIGIVFIAKQKLNTYRQPTDCQSLQINPYSVFNDKPLQSPTTLDKLLQSPITLDKSLQNPIALEQQK